MSCPIPNDGLLIQIWGDPPVYYMQGGIARWVKTGQVLEDMAKDPSLDLKKDDRVWMDKNCFGPHKGDSSIPPIGKPIESWPEVGTERTICVVRLTHDQSIPTADGAYPDQCKVQFDTVDVDTRGCFDTNLNRFVAKEPGYHQFDAQIWLDGTPANKLWKLKFRFNGAPNHPDHKHSWMAGAWNTTDTGGKCHDLSPIVRWPAKWMSPGDYMEVFVAHHVGENAIIQGREPYQGHKTWMSVIKL